MGVETEFKLALAGEREAAMLREALTRGGTAPTSTVLQVNHFFDDRARSLRARGSVLRLRQEGPLWFLTLKGPTGSAPAAGSGLSSKREEEISIGDEEASALLAGAGSPLALLIERLGLELEWDVGELHHVGSFQNERTRIGPAPLPGTRSDLRVVFELDRTEFPGGRVDHELELEVEPADAEECGRALRALFERTGLAWEPSQSKAARFFG